jgi:hypothetical protein
MGACYRIPHKLGKATFSEGVPRPRSSSLVNDNSPLLGFCFSKILEKRTSVHVRQLALWVKRLKEISINKAKIGVVHKMSFSFWGYRGYELQSRSHLFSLILHPPISLFI